MQATALDELHQPQLKFLPRLSAHVSWISACAFVVAHPCSVVILARPPGCQPSPGSLGIIVPSERFDNVELRVRLSRKILTSSAQDPDHFVSSVGNHTKRDRLCCKRTKRARRAFEPLYGSILA